MFKLPTEKAKVSDPRFKRGKNFYIREEDIDLIKERPNELRVKIEYPADTAKKEKK